MPNTSLEHYFSSEYPEARERFLQAATKRGGLHTPLLIPSLKGAHGEPLSIDTVTFGRPDAPHLLLHISGTHGIEGYLGSAIQLAILESEWTPPGDVAVAFIHALNPWGMSHLRRVTANNIDLNRNFLFSSSAYAGTPPNYAAISPLINPEHPPSRIECFTLKALLAIARYGFTALKQTIAGGQYEHPRGLFYGGKEREIELTLLENWLREALPNRQAIAGIEVHSGLGPFGYDTLFSNIERDSKRGSALSTLFTHPLSTDRPDASVGFVTNGDTARGVAAVADPLPCAWILQEFGTYPPLTVLSALRAENMHHHYGGASLTHWSKTRLREIFNPTSPEWRRTVVTRGLHVFKCALNARELWDS